MTVNCTITLPPYEKGLVCTSPANYPLDVYFHPKNGSQRKVATCNSPGFDIYNDHGFSCKNGDGSSTQISVPTNFTEPGEFFCQVSGIGMHSKNSMSCHWPPNDAATRYPNTMKLALPLGIGLPLLVLALLCIPLSRIAKKNKTWKIWTLYNKLFRKKTKENCSDEDFKKVKKELLEKESEKIEDDEESTDVPVCGPIMLRGNITTNARMRKLNENTDVAEEAQDPVDYSVIDMAMKTPVQIEATDYGKEVKDTSTSTCDTTVVDIHSGGIETTSANGSNSDRQIQMESDHPEFQGEVEEEFFSFNGIEIDMQGEKENDFPLHQEV